MLFADTRCGMETPSQRDLTLCKHDELCMLGGSLTVRMSSTVASSRLSQELGCVFFFKGGASQRNILKCAGIEQLPRSALRCVHTQQLRVCSV